MRKFKMSILFVLLLGIVISCSGCNTEEDAYQTILEQDLGSSLSVQSELDRMYDGLSSVAPFVIVFSILFGTLGAIVSKRNKGARRSFITTFMIGGPFLVILLVYGMGFFLAMFIQ